MNYKVRLEHLLQDMSLVEEVAQYASLLDTAEVDTMNFLRESTYDSTEYTASRDVDGLQHQTGPRFVDSSENAGNVPKDLLDNDSDSDLTDDDGDDDESEEQEESDNDEDNNNDNDDGLEGKKVQDATAPGAVHFSSKISSSGASTTNMKVKNMLDRWDEPVNKLDRRVDASIADILKFRKAMATMDDRHPFSIHFGPASTRNECIKSTQKVFRRLTRYAGSADVPFGLIKQLAVSRLHGETMENEVKVLRLKALFHPNSADAISLVSFSQACDGVYKRLRFFRASVGNSSVIDRVLESIVDSIFNFVLALVILTMLQINPYPLLVSLSTMMVSFAFAFGPSASRYIEVSG